MKDKVLIIEDSRSFSTILKQLIFEAHGLEAVIAQSLTDLKQLLADDKDQFFVATVDLNLPDAPNGEALEPVVEADIPAIVFTASKDMSLRNDLWRRGIADYANKDGTYNIEYVVWMINRIYNNRNVEILVVDDSNIALNAAESLLHRQNFIVHTADSAESALEIINQQPKIRLAIIDGQMEGMDGYELTSKIRQNFPRETMEIIGMSSVKGDGMSAKFIKSGANDFVRKPFAPEEFLCRVDHALDRLDNYQKLKELNRIKNQFLGTAAHDIRGPLGAIKTASEILNHTTNPQRISRLISMINNNSTDLLALLDSLLDISAIESGITELKKQPINFGEIIQERIELYQPEASNKQLQFETAIDKDITLSLDRIKMHQVIDNLITNAIKYSENNGVLRIDTEKKSKVAELRVQDNGPGIPAEEQDSLFTSFTSLSSKATGGEKKTGLGLAIAKSIVDAHAGQIFYHHNDSMHSTFTVQLPLN